MLYNALLLVIGVLSVAAMEWLLTPLLPGGDDLLESGLGIAVYGFMANVCYTLGGAIELFSRRRNAAAARQRGKWMFRMGLLFSCALTSLPLWFACSWRVAQFVVSLIHRTT